MSFEHDEWKERSEILTYADEISFTITLYSLCSKSSSTTLNSTKSIENQTKKIMPTSTSYYETSMIDFDSVLQTNETLNTSTANAQSNPIDTLVSLPPKSMADLLNKSNDFEINFSSSNRTPNLAYWYGISKFLLITPTRSDVYIDNESRARVILMSASVAINNTGWYFKVLFSSYR